MSARRDELDPADRAERSRRIADRVLALPEVIEARTVMAFWSFGSEVETAGLLGRLRERGARVALPRVEDGEVVAVVHAAGGPVAPSRFGAMEPSGRDVLDPREIDLVIVPGVAFDRRGARVGYGGGFYDRFLARVRPDAPAIAVAFSEQVVDEVPEGPMDRRVDAVVTDAEVIRPRLGGLNGQSNA